jgi:hypothetical protein
MSNNLTIKAWYCTGAQKHKWPASGAEPVKLLNSYWCPMCLRALLEKYVGLAVPLNEIDAGREGLIKRR